MFKAGPGFCQIIEIKYQYTVNSDIFAACNFREFTVIQCTRSLLSCVGRRTLLSLQYYPNLPQQTERWRQDYNCRSIYWQYADQYKHGAPWPQVGSLEVYELGSPISLSTIHKNCDFLLLLTPLAPAYLLSFMGSNPMGYSTSSYYPSNKWTVIPLTLFIQCVKVWIIIPYLLNLVPFEACFKPVNFSSFCLRSLPFSFNHSMTTRYYYIVLWNSQKNKVQMRNSLKLRENFNGFRHGAL